VHLSLFETWQFGLLEVLGGQSFQLVSRALVDIERKRVSIRYEEWKDHEAERIGVFAVDNLDLSDHVGILVHCPCEENDLELI